MRDESPIHEPPVGSGGHGRRRRSLTGLLISFALVAALVILAATRVDLSAATHAISSVAPAWIALAFAAMASAFAARGESWFASIRAAAPAVAISRIAVTRSLLIGMATSTVAPARVGEAARAWVLSRRLRGPQDLVLVAGTILSQTVVNVLALAILAAVALGGIHLGTGRIVTVAAALAIPLLVIAALMAGPSLLSRLTDLGAGRVSAAAAWLLRQFLQLRHGFGAFVRPRAAAHTASAQMTAWALQLVACYAVLLALHLQAQADVFTAAAVLVAVNVTAIVPVTPANVGVFQAACIGALAPFGIASGKGLAYGLVLQAVEVISALGLGIPALLLEGLSWTDLRRRTYAPRTEGEV